MSALADPGVDRPRMTVAIPTCNGARHLRETLQGILDQAGADFDLLVSDDRSDDETLEIVRVVAGDRARIAVNSERLGLAGNWNQCVALCRTPLVTVFHQDDRMRPGHLASHGRAFAADPRVGLVWSAAEVIDDESRAVPSSVVEPGGLDMPDHVFAAGELVARLAAANPVRCSAVSLRAKAHAQAGGFDPAYRYVVDWDFWIRVARTWSVTWLAAPTVDVRWHSASETHRFRTGTDDLEETARLQAGLFAREGREWPNLVQIRRASDRRLARAYLNRAHDLLRAGLPALARTCLARAVSLAPSMLGVIALDPRLAAQMTALAVAPRHAGRWFGPREIER